MTRDEAVTRIKRGLAFRTGTTQDNAIIDALQEAQRKREMGKTLPWFLIEEDETLTGVADANEVLLPDGFIRVVEGDGVKFYEDGDFVRKLDKADRDQNILVWKDSTQTTPFSYSLRKSSIEVYPTPDAAWTLVLSYYKEDTILDSNITNNWLTYAPDVLIAEAGLLMAADLQMDLAVQKFSALLTSADAKLLAHIVDRETEDEEVIMGGNN